MFVFVFFIPITKHGVNVVGESENMADKPLTISNWKEYFETIESYINGERVSQSFK